MKRHALGIGMNVDDFTYQDPWAGEQTLYGQLGRSPGGLWLIFLRYAGCPLCQYKVVELRRDYAKFAAKGVQILVVLQSPCELVSADLAKDQIPMAVACDPRAELFARFGVHAGNVLGYVAPPVVYKSALAALKGYKRGVKTGAERELQLPAAFLVHPEGRLRWSYYGAHIDDLPSIEQLLARC